MNLLVLVAAIGLIILTLHVYNKQAAISMRFTKKAIEECRQTSEYAQHHETSGQLHLMLLDLYITRDRSGNVRRIDVFADDGLKHRVATVVAGRGVLIPALPFAIPGSQATAHKLIVLL